MGGTAESQDGFVYVLKHPNYSNLGGLLHWEYTTPYWDIRTELLTRRRVPNQHPVRFNIYVARSGGRRSETHFLSLNRILSPNPHRIPSMRGQIREHGPPTAPSCACRLESDRPKQEPIEMVMLSRVRWFQGTHCSTSSFPQ